MLPSLARGIRGMNCSQGCLRSKFRLAARQIYQPTHKKSDQLTKDVNVVALITLTMAIGRWKIEDIAYS